MPEPDKFSDILIERLENQQKMLDMDKQVLFLTLKKVNERRFGYSDTELIQMMQDIDAELKKQEQV